MSGCGVALAFTPLGIRPLNQQPAFDAADDDFAPAIVQPIAPEVVQLALPQVALPTSARANTTAPSVAGAAPVASKPITGAMLVRQAKARVREIRQIQRAASALTPELEGLERLIAAATTKPTAMPRAANL